MRGEINAITIRRRQVCVARFIIQLHAYTWKVRYCFKIMKIISRVMLSVSCFLGLLKRSRKHFILDDFSSGVLLSDKLWPTDNHFNMMVITGWFLKPQRINISTSVNRRQLKGFVRLQFLIRCHCVLLTKPTHGVINATWCHYRLPSYCEKIKLIGGRWIGALYWPLGWNEAEEFMNQSEFALYPYSGKTFAFILNVTFWLLRH